MMHPIAHACIRCALGTPCVPYVNSLLHRNTLIFASVKYGGTFPILKGSAYVFFVYVFTPVHIDLHIFLFSILF